MTDIQTGWSNAAGSGDWIFVPAAAALQAVGLGASLVGATGLTVQAELDASTSHQWVADLVTAVLISLFSDAAADDDDVIPDGTANRRGWWAGDIGSKLWLLSRVKATAGVATQAEGYARDALAWLVTDGIASTVQVSSQWLSTSALALTITITRASGTAVTLAFANLWDFL
ncbi:MAG TPA: phage GP46 family protein [Novosphingobium sp.]|nr:phage GP46 family protein [Novosphingobium sp.]